MLLYAGNGDGTLQDPVYTHGDVLYRVSNAVVADFNEDGKPDGLVAGNAHLFLGNGTIALPTETELLPYSSYSAFAFFLDTADVNFDGHVDIVGAGSFGNAKVLAGNGNGTFAAPIAFGSGATDSIATGDLNGDGRVDLIIPQGHSGTVAVLLNTTPDPIAPTITSLTASPNPISVIQTSVVAATATDNLKVSGGSYVIDGGAPTTFTGASVSTSLSGAALGVGVHSVVVTFTDSTGNSTTATVYVVVYDTSAGFVTGAGQIVPGGPTADVAGSCSASPPAGSDVLPGLNCSSKAIVGTNVKYQSGGGAPTGMFHLMYGSFHFQSSTLDWLTVANPNNATFQGSGTIGNGTTLYPFRVAVRDGNANGGTLPDRLVVKIYAPGADPNTATPLYKASGNVTTGSVTIH